MPRHDHSCMECRFVATVGDSDLYIHEAPDGKEYVWRFSPHPEDFVSLPGWVVDLMPEPARSRWTKAA